MARVVAADARRVGAAADRHARLDHRAHRLDVCRGRLAVPLDEIFAGKCQPVLHGDAAAQRLDAVDRARRDRLRVIDHPALGVSGGRESRLEHVEDMRDRLVVGRMNADRPLGLDQDANDVLQVLRDPGCHSGRGLMKSS